MASLSCSQKSITSFCSELLHSPIVGTSGRVGLITQGIDELLTLFFYSSFMAGLVLVFRRASTQPPVGACREGGATEVADVLRPSEALTTAPPARKTMLVVFCGLLLGILCFWGFVHVQVPKAGGGDGSVSLDHELWLGFFSFMYSTAGLLLREFLLDSAKRHFVLGILNGRGIRHGRLLVTLSCSALIHLLVPETGGSIESGPAGFEVPLFLLFLCVMGLMLVFFGTSANLGDIVSINPPSCRWHSALQGSFTCSLPALKTPVK